MSLFKKTVNADQLGVSRPRPDEERYTLQESAQKLGVSKKTLENWIIRHDWRELVDKQVFEYDQRARYLTREQLQKLARDHRRELADLVTTRQKTEVEREVLNEYLIPLVPFEKHFYEIRKLIGNTIGNMGPVIPRLNQLSAEELRVEWEKLADVILRMQTMLDELGQSSVRAGDYDPNRLNAML